jgi:hypothetical protein
LKQAIIVIVAGVSRAVMLGDELKTRIIFRDMNPTEVGVWTRHGAFLQPGVRRSMRLGVSYAFLNDETGSNAAQQTYQFSAIHFLSSW